MVSTFHAWNLARVCAIAVAFLGAPPAGASAATRYVAAGADLQAAINEAQPGDVLELQSGATFTGNFILPTKPGDLFIVIRTGGADDVLPGPGARVAPEHAGALAKVKSPNTMPALRTADGAHHWRVELVEFQANQNGSGDIIVLGGSGSQTQVAQMPHTLVFDRIYVHGDPVAGQKRGIALNSGLTHIVNSYIADIKAVGMDSQAIAGWNGSGPYLIENNYLEAAGENVMFGGADPSIWNLVPSDITIRRNYMTKPLQWRNERWSVKNAFELKNARRVLIEGNIFERVWQGGQAGFAIVLTPRNQDGRAPWSVVEDVTFRHNIVRHAGGAFNITGFDDLQASAQGRRIRIQNNLFYDIDAANWGGGGRFLQIGNAPREVIVERNTVLHSGNVVHAHGRSQGAPAPIEGFVFRDNLLRHNAYGIIGDGLAVGLPTLAAYFPGGVVENNVLAGGRASQYPAANHFPTTEEFNAQFEDPAQGNFALKAESAFRFSAPDGGPLGADLGTLQSVLSGTPQPSRPVASAPQPSPAPAPAPPGVPPAPGTPAPAPPTPGSSESPDQSPSLPVPPTGSASSDAARALPTGRPRPLQHLAL